MGPMAAHVKSLRTRCIIKFVVNGNVRLHPPLAASDSTVSPVSSRGITAPDCQLPPGPAADDQRRRRAHGQLAQRILFQHRTPIDFAIAVAIAVAMGIARVL